MANLLEEETRTADVALRVLLALRNVMLSHCGDQPASRSISKPAVVLGRKPEMMVRVCVLQGVGVLFIPKIGLTLFIVLYTFGNICALSRSAPTASGSTYTFYKIFFFSYRNVA